MRPRRLSPAHHAATLPTARAALGAVLVFLLVLAVVPPAGARTRTKPKSVHCRNGTVKRTIAKRRRGRKVRETVCVKKTAKKPAAAQPPNIATPLRSPAGPRTVHLHAHLDPSFTQSPSNPLAVTYTYSASASNVNPRDATETPEPELPAGVLQFYSDGTLACSINVGGTTSGGECPVTYTGTGTHTVITTYLSGSTSATETTIEHIEPFKTAAQFVSEPGSITATLHAIDQAGANVPVQASEPPVVPLPVPTQCASLEVVNLAEPAGAGVALPGKVLGGITQEPAAGYAGSPFLQLTLRYTWTPTREGWVRFNAEAEVEKAQILAGDIVARCHFPGAPGYAPSNETTPLLLG